MKRICPNPIPWSDVFQRLKQHARVHRCQPPNPPTPLILAGWAFSNDVDKLLRWEDTVAWAMRNGCPELTDVPEGDFYCVDEPTTYAVGPLGGPMYRLWDSKTKERPDPDELAAHLSTLESRWADVVGPELARSTRPLAFRGAKARRLLVQADKDACPPWGSWFHRSREESKRRTFTRLRASINEAIAPHEVDHVDFMPE